MTKQPKRPYLLRALYDWIVDSDLTPYLLVNARAADVAVPAEHVNEDGKIVLNVAPHAVDQLSMNTTAIACHCRFGGRSFEVYLPMTSIEAIYARETGEGMAFEAEPPSPPPPDDSGPPESGGDKSSGGGHLKVVK